MQNENLVKNPFAEWLNSQLSIKRRAEVWELIKTACEISDSTLRRRVEDPSQWSQVEKRYLARMAKKKVSELFPE